MDFLGIGPLELMFILIIALIVLGPNDMAKAGRTIGRFMRRVVTSSTWQEMRKIRYLPNKLMREAGLEDNDLDLSKDIDNFGKDISSWTTPPPILDSPDSLIKDAQETSTPEEEPVILPPTRAQNTSPSHIDETETNR